MVMVMVIITFVIMVIVVIFNKILFKSILLLDFTLVKYVKARVYGFRVRVMDKVGMKVKVSVAVMVMLGFLNYNLSLNYYVIKYLKIF